MAIAIAKPTVASGRADYSSRGLRYRVRDLTFSGNYATGGETVNASDVQLKSIQEVHFSGQVAAASTPTSAVLVGCVIASDSRSCAIRSYELGGTGAAGDPLAEKTNAEAYISGQTVRAVFVGL